MAKKQNIENVSEVDWLMKVNSQFLRSLRVKVTHNEQNWIP